RLAEWGSGPSGPRGRGPEDRHQSTVVSWLASLAPPPGLRPYSPVPLPFHGGEVRFVRAPSRPLAVLPRFTAVSRGRSPFCSRPLPAFGRSPPFDCRFTGEKSVLFAPPPG